jgi:hypothetical protein
MVAAAPTANDAPPSNAIEQTPSAFRRDQWPLAPARLSDAFPNRSLNAIASVKVQKQ